MGFRTVVVLLNDLAHKWETDPDLGKKIWNASAVRNSNGQFPAFEFGSIIEQEHADCQTVIITDGYNGYPISYSMWKRDESNDDRNLRLIKEAAAQFGYRLVKK